MAIRITDDKSALAFLSEIESGFLGYATRTRVSDDGTESTLFVIPDPCQRCGGSGNTGHYWVDHGVCFECHGAKTNDRVRCDHAVDVARREKARVASEKRREAKYAAKEAGRAKAAERKLEGQRQWCEDNGHGRLTFAELKEKQFAEKLAKESYVGKIKERREFDLTLEAMISVNGYYGIAIIHKFKDANGNAFVWKTGDWIAEEATGQLLRVKATVKSHSEYRGAKQTELSRVVELKAEKV